MTTNELFNQFQNPGVEWRGKPFWSWNGELDRDELIYQSHIFKEMGFGGYFMHSRAGLITEYLGDDWFDRINSTADAGEKDGLEVWLYDEDRWPSGSAGGKVTEDPQYRMKSLVLFETSPEAFEWDDDILAVYAARIGKDKISAYGCRKLSREDNLTDILASLPGEGTPKLLIFKIVPDAPNSNYNGNTYIDTMNIGAVNKFLELTHEEYRKRCGDRIGTSIKGIFTDEPHRGLLMCSLSDDGIVRRTSVPWTNDIFAEFEKRYGYDVFLRIPELFYRIEGEKFSKTRVDYIDLTCNLFNERFTIPVNDWCEKNNMLFTGHFLHENSMTSQTVPNGSLMRGYQYMGLPGIDLLTDKSNEYWVAKQISSVSRQMNKPFLLSELYGCTGWEFSLRKHKIVGDWQALFGINVRCPHLSWYTMEGESKRDYPASISYQSPYYKDYNFVESYFARFGMMMAQGKADCDVLVLNPVESVWGLTHIGWAQWVGCTDRDINAYERIYAETFRELIGNHIDFDYGEEQIMAESARVDTDASGKPILCVGEASYRTVVVSGMLTMRTSTFELLRDFLEAGGNVIFAGELPSFIGGLPSDDCRTLLGYAGAAHTSLDKISGTIRDSSGGASVSVEAGKNVFMQTKTLENAYITALLNIDTVNRAEPIVVRCHDKNIRSVQRWNLETGCRYALDYKPAEDGVSVRTSLEPAGSMILVFTEEDSELPLPDDPAVTVTGELNGGEFRYHLDEPNVCVLDFARMKFGNDTEFGTLDEVLQLDNKLRDRIGIERRGGEMLQPWFSKLNHTESYGKLTLDYPFVIDRIPAGEIWLAGERPELQEYFCNDVRLTNEDPHSWWVDNAFKKMKIPAGALHIGENHITITTDFKRTTNIEAVYLVGDFGVIAKAGASRIVGLPETLSVTEIADRNLPFYSGCVSVIIPPDVYAPLTDKNADRILLNIPEASGTHITVTAGGKKTTLAWEPWTADVTEAVRTGSDITVTLVNSRRNTFGPLHCVPTIQYAYSPGSFVSTGDSFTETYAHVPAQIGKIRFMKADDAK